MRILSRFLSMLLIISLIFSFTAVFAFADNENEKKDEKKSAGVSDAVSFLLENKESKYLYPDPVASVESKYPSSFDLRDKGVVTPVKSQSPFATCWGFAAIAASETSILSELGKTYDETKLDLSEHHVAYFARQPLKDGSKQDGEGIHMSDENDIMGGAFIVTATSLFSSGVGVVDESLVPYRGLSSNTDSAYCLNLNYSADDDWTIPPEYEFYQTYELEESSILSSPAVYAPDTDQDDFLAREKGYLGYDAAATEAIKSEIFAGRAVSIAFCADTYLPGEQSENPVYINTAGKNWAHYTFDGGIPNHAVTIVGWDDNFPASEFLDHSDDQYGDGTAHQPEGNGAWICKNSWGSATESFPHFNSWGNENEQGKTTGYFYISYYDRSISVPESFDFDVSKNDNDYIIDQYDYMQNHDSSGWLNSSPIQMSNVFTAEYDQTIRALSCQTYYPGCEVLYQVYLLDSGNSTPDGGKLAAEASAEYPHAGYHRINLEKSVDVSKGQKYAVVVSQKIQNDNKEYFEISCDKGQNEAAVLLANKDVHRMHPNTSDDQLNLIQYYYKGIVNPGESYIFIQDLNTWYDFSEIVSELQKTDDYKDYDFDNFSIKAYSNFKNSSDADALAEQMPKDGLKYAEPAGTVDYGALVKSLIRFAITIVIVVLIIKFFVKRSKKKKYYKQLEIENAQLKEQLQHLTERPVEPETK